MKRIETLKKIKELLDTPDTTAKDLAEVVAEDQTLAGSLMHFIRSFGFPPEDCTLAGAIVLLGDDAFRNIVAESQNFSRD